MPGGVIMVEDVSGGVHSVEDMAAVIAAQRQRIESDEDLHRELTEGRPDGNPIQLGPRLPSAEEWAAEQIQGAANKADKWLAKTTRPRKNFKEEALKPDARKRYKDSMQKVIAEDRHAGGMENVDVDETMDIIKAGGSSAYSEGVARREKKIARRVKELHADRLALCNHLDSMPTATDADREKKMVENRRGLIAIGKARRGG
jgi:hypothetical protein